MRTLNQYINEWKYNDGNNVYDPHKIVYRDLEAWSNMLLKKYKIHCSDFDFGIVDIYPDNAETHDEQKYPHIPITVDSKWWHGCSGWKNFSISDESNFNNIISYVIYEDGESKMIFKRIESERYRLDVDTKHKNQYAFTEHNAQMIDKLFKSIN